jgi:hypothetical protein
LVVDSQVIKAQETLEHNLTQQMYCTFIINKLLLSSSSDYPLSETRMTKIRVEKDEFADISSGSDVDAKGIPPIFITLY